MDNLNGIQIAQTAPISIVVPTCKRVEALARTVASLSKQDPLPAELIVIDGSPDDSTKDMLTACAKLLRERGCAVVWQRAIVVGAAAQRNQGVKLARQTIVGFFDDDILFEPDCIARLWSALQSNAALGGVSAMILNQQYHPPGRVSRLVFRLMADRCEGSYAGRVLGPAVNLLPEDREDLPEVVTVEWLNTTCTLYRREALPQPAFSDFFFGYSLLEDLALSLTVGKHSKLANARTARIYHDSQPGSHKDQLVATSRMELVNRHYVMTKVMGKRRVGDYGRLVLWEVFQLASSAVDKRGGIDFWRELCGKTLGLCNILSNQINVGQR